MGHPITDVRCQGKRKNGRVCNQLLARLLDVGAGHASEITCRRCGTINYIEGAVELVPIEHDLVTPRRSILQKTKRKQRGG
jgi:phage FluMu protein Com